MPFYFFCSIILLYFSIVFVYISWGSVDTPDLSHGILNPTNDSLCFCVIADAIISDNIVLSVWSNTNISRCRSNGPSPGTYPPAWAATISFAQRPSKKSCRVISLKARRV